VKSKKQNVRSSTEHYYKQSHSTSISKPLIVLIVLLLLTILVAVFADDVRQGTEQGLYPQKYALYVTKYAEKYNIPSHIVYGVIRTESNFDSNAVSSVGAIGLMQLMPDTFTWISNDLLGERLPAAMAYDPETNIRYGTYLLSRFYARYGDWNAALAAYNAGPGRVDGWLKDAQYITTEGKLNPEAIPFEETRRYVEKVQQSADTYLRLYATTSQ
jgi:soluble lytic murein transglycosylase